MLKKTFFGLAAAALLLAGCVGEKPAETTSSGDTTATSSNTPGATPNTGSGPAANDPSTQPPGTCGGKTCAPSESCVSYYGIAGPRGPQFHDCVIPCRRGAPNDGCPAGKTCHVIADGPGDVCN